MNGLTAQRQAAGLSMQKLADRSGVSLSTIYKIEHGKHSPSTSTLEKLAREIGCRVVDLVDDPLADRRPHTDAIVRELIQAVEDGETSAFDALETLEALGVISRVPREANVGGDMAKLAV